MRKIKLSPETFQQIFDLYEEGHSFKRIKEILDVDMHDRNLATYYRRYKKHGTTALNPRTHNASYSQVFKSMVINEYFKDGMSINELAVKYNIPGSETIRRWIIRYTDGKENKSYSPKPEVYNMKPKKLTYTQKLEAVNDCLSHDKDYKGTAERYRVNYSQIYSWVKKFEEHGPEGPIDSRGKTKPATARSSEDEYKLKIKALEERNKYLQMENEVLKKRREIERQLMNQEFDN